MKLLILILIILIINIESFNHHNIGTSKLSSNRRDLFRLFADDNNSNNQNIKLTKEEIIKVNSEIDTIKELLIKASNKEVDDTDSIVDGLLKLEKLMRKKNTYDDNKTSQDTLNNLNGAWRLVFTTGTVNTQKKLGRINYFPIKAVQTFDTATYKISNGIYLGDFAILKFFGTFSWNLKIRKLEFDFDEISLLGLLIGLPKGGAQKIGSSTGLGSPNPKPFFNWISADESIATARGGGGGLALWRKL
jgi:hypothetical protein